MKPAVPGEGPVARASVARVGTATAISATCGYAVLYLAARDLTPASFAVFAVFWGAFGLVNGASSGLLQESTREVRLAHAEAGTHPAPARITRPPRVAAAAGGLVAVAAIATSPLWARFVFVEQRWLSVGLIGVGLVNFAVHATLLGMLAGANRWSQYGTLMVADALTRVAVAITTFLAGWGLAGFLVATVAGSASWLVLLAASPTTRASAAVPTRADIATFLRGGLHSTTAAGTSAILVMGFPVLLQTTVGDLGAEGGVIILAVTATRAPLLVPMTALQGNLIAHFIDQGVRPALPLLVAMVAGIGAAGVPVAALAGPTALQWLFGGPYRASGVLLAWLTVAATAMAMLTLTGQAAVAAALHRGYALGWMVATGVTAALLLLPIDLATRTATALLCGPVVGIAVHLSALRAGSTPPSQTPRPPARPAVATPELPPPG